MQQANSAKDPNLFRMDGTPKRHSPSLPIKKKKTLREGGEKHIQRARAWGDFFRLRKEKQRAQEGDVRDGRGSWGA